MASIRVKQNNKGKKYYVVYFYHDDEGIRRQKWDPCKTMAEAKTRRAQVEQEQYSGEFVRPQNLTVDEFLEEFVSTYGRVKWGVNTYDHNTAIIRNYISPALGSMKVQDITTREADRFYVELRKKPAILNVYHKNVRNVSDHTVERVHRLLKCAFSQAERWEIIKKNPFLNCNVEKAEMKQRDIWDMDMIKRALDCCQDCKDNRLYVAISLAFACALRMGEIVGLTWDNVHIDHNLVMQDEAYVEVKQVLGRVNLNALEQSKERDQVFFVFPPNMDDNNRTGLILKKPKTKSSIRKVWLPKTLAMILLEWKQAQQKDIDFLGAEYKDYDLVISLHNGRPMEGNVLNKHFKKLIDHYDLPNVDFHSLRHSSTTYKLIHSHGDIKAVQGDTGHATEGMVTGWYSRILDEGRKVNAQRFEQQFYQTDTVNLAAVSAVDQGGGVDLGQLQALAELVQGKPELLTLLTQLASGSIQ